MHDMGMCDHERDHDRSLPDGPWEVLDAELHLEYTGTDKGCALQVAGECDGYVYKGEQRVAADGLMGCNDCGEPLYYCENTHWYHHVDPKHECFLVGPDEFDYYAKVQDATH